jgi:hypothetical protein
MIVEDDESSVVRFYSGLRRDIQDIVDYKEFNTVNQLFQFAMLAEKGLQGREMQNRSSTQSSYTPCTTPSLGLPKATTFRPPDQQANGLLHPRMVLLQHQKHLLNVLHIQSKSAGICGDWRWRLHQHL